LARIQLCGRLVVELDGRRVEERLPGRQGRLLFVFLAVNRLRPMTRDELVAALWPDGRDGGLAPLLSKLRHVVPLSGRGAVRLSLPADAWIDLEAAREAVHRAESAVALGDWAEAWAPARVAIHTGARGFLPGEDVPWADAVRRELEDLRVRALEAAAEAGLALGGAELAGAKRSARTLVELEPYRDSGYRFLMQALALEGNRAEALALYERLRTLLRDELGAAPAPETQALHRLLLG
jgi:SARP family transcriptional regulator, regulator of embCAB operon